MLAGYGFATLAEFKRRLGIVDTVDDVLLQEMLDDVSATIEMAASRQLRREHRTTEYFAGGGRVIFPRITPVIKVHSIRESSDSDFDVSANYEELIEDDDFVLEQGGRRPDESQSIRRLDGNWLGTKQHPKQVQVIYTGGYKTDEEVAFENTEITIGSASNIYDFAIKQTATGARYEIENEKDTTIPVLFSTPASTDRRGFFRFSVANTLLPVWSIIGLTLKMTSVPSGIEEEFGIYSLVTDPRLQGDLQTLHSSGVSAADVLDSDSDTVLAASQVDGSPGATYTISIHTLDTFDDVRANCAKTLADNSYIAFMLKQVYTFASNQSTIDASEHATGAQRPQLIIRHGLDFTDRLKIPGDLRNACLQQTIHEYQTRRHPGMKQQSMRGVSIASGASYSKGAIDLLPKVLRIAMAYKRPY